MSHQPHAMPPAPHNLEDLELVVRAGRPFSAEEAERVLACPDLVSVGVLGELGRRQAFGDAVTFGRVATVTPGASVASAGDAAEIRLAGVPASIDEARAWVRAAAAGDRGPDVALTGFSLADLAARCGYDPRALSDAAAALKEDGLEAVADVPVDRFESTEALLAAVRAVTRAQLGAWRFTVERAGLGERLALIDRAVRVQHETGAGRAFAPLPRLDPVETPSTGYDDVKTIAVARLRCPATIAIQVDWPLYGPKLAQVAIAYGASDVDGVAAVDTLGLGHRRSPAEDVARQIRAAGGQPVERTGRFAARG